MIYSLLLSLLISGATVSAADTPLADAAERADWQVVSRLLKENADPHAPQVDGMTALHWAVWHDQTDAALQLIEHQADVDAKTRYGVTPLSLACRNGNAEIVTSLLNAGADAKSTVAGGETALMTASRTGRAGVVELLIQAGADVHATEQKGQTALMWAAAEGHAEVVALLLKAEADFQTPLKSGFTPLFFAVREGHVDAAAVLLAAGADVNGAMRPENARGRSPRSGTSPLLLAVENGHFELALRLLEAGADPNDQRSGYTPLHVITWVRKPNLGDGLDGTPSPIGSGRVTSLEFVKALVENGADVNARLKRGPAGRARLNRTGATPFLLSADTADIPLMKLLLELGADPTIPNADQCPPLLAAAGIGTIAPGEEAGTEAEALEAVRLLLDLGADINAVDRNGETAMHGAAYKSLPKMVEFLAANGADIDVWNVENKYGWSPLLIAEGHRQGNFKPAPATIEAIHRVMRAAGIEPPQPTPRKQRQREEYAPEKKDPKPKSPTSASPQPGAGPG